MRGRKPEPHALKLLKGLPTQGEFVVCPRQFQRPASDSSLGVVAAYLPRFAGDTLKI